MNTAKEFFDRLKSDEAFAKEVGESILAKQKAGAADIYETIIPVAEDKGCQVTKEDLDKIVEEAPEELSEEELGKVAGGTGCLIATSAIPMITNSATNLSPNATIVVTAMN